MNATNTFWFRFSTLVKIFVLRVALRVQEKFGTPKYCDWRDIARLKALYEFVTDEKPKIPGPVPLMECDDFTLVDAEGRSQLFTADEIGLKLKHCVEASYGCRLFVVEDFSKPWICDEHGTYIADRELRNESGIDLGDVPDALYEKLVREAIVRREGVKRLVPESSDVREAVLPGFKPIYARDARLDEQSKLYGDPDVDPVGPRT